MLTLALSPYELTARSKAAALSLLLGDEVMTLAPGDLGEAAADTGEANMSAVLAFARAWGWTRELWEEGVLTGRAGAVNAAEGVRTAWSRIEADEALAGMRRLSRGRKDLPSHLDAGRLVEDLARGGLDPSVSVAVEAGMVEAASRAHIGVVRAIGAGRGATGGGESTLARLIERASEPMARLTLAAPDEVDEASVIEMRRLLGEALTPLRSALGEVIHACYEGAEAGRVREVCDRRVEPMARELVREAVSFETAMDGPGGGGVRAVAVRITRVPSDVVLRAAEGAVRGRGAGAIPAPPGLARAAVVLTVKPLAWDAASI